MPFKKDIKLIEKYLEDTTIWKHVLQNCKRESDKMKIEMAEALVRTNDLKLLEDAEQYQNMFLQHEQVIDLIRHEIQNILKTEYKSASPQKISELRNTLCVLGKDISKVLVDCDNVRRQFYSFLLRCHYRHKLVV